MATQDPPELTRDDSAEEPTPSPWEADLAHLVDRAPSGLVVVDEAGTVQYANATAMQLLGTSSLQGREFGVPLSRQRTVLIDLRGLDGRMREAEMQVTAVRTGGRDCTLVTLIDVTHRAEEAQRLHQVVRQREDLVALASHELRGPLTSMTDAVHALVEQWEGLPPIRRLSLLRRILDGTRRMDQTLTHVLDASRLDAGLIEPVHVDTVLIDVVLDRAPELPQMLTDLDVRIPEHVRVLAHPSHVWTVLANLLTNASRFAGGLITLEAATDGDWCQIVVSDQGPGIPAEHRRRIFERYARLDRDRDLDGAGLGLWIAAEVVSAYDGSIRVEPQPRDLGLEESEAGLDEGARFVVRLPAPRDGDPQLRLVRE